MTEIYKKRFQWCGRDSQDRLHKFNTEAEAKDFFGLKEPVLTKPKVLEALYKVTNDYKGTFEKLKEIENAED